MSHDHEYQHMNPDRFADSAGVPWEGRHFEANPWAGDDGSADTNLVAAIQALRSGDAVAEDVLVAMRAARLLVPLLANLGEAGEGAHGQTVDKSADLSIVSISSPDGQVALPVFSSVAAMSRWNSTARPVPIETPRVALAAASEGNGRIVLDPGSDTEFVVRRTAFSTRPRCMAHWICPTRPRCMLRAHCSSKSAAVTRCIRCPAWRPRSTSWRKSMPRPVSRSDSAAASTT
ncbi:MAG: SseB family protein [Micrococcales bacterium]